MSKKIFAILLAVVLAFSVVSVGAAAAGTPNGNESMTVTITTDRGSETYGAEETVTVNVSIACNYNVPSFRFPIMFDSSVLEADDFIGLTAHGTCASSGTISSNISTAANSFIPEGYDSSSFGCILVQWVANVQNSAVGCLNNANGELAFSFELITKRPAAATATGSIFIPAETDLLYYQAIQNPADATSFYYLNADTCAMTFVPATVTVTGVDVDIIPNAGNNSTAVIDNENLVIYGLRSGMQSKADVEAFFEATGGGMLRIVMGENGFGTGTKVDLIYDGSIIRTYKVVIFGDVDGDGDIANPDIAKMLTFVSGSATPESLESYTLDFYHDYNIDNLDQPTEISAVGGSLTIDQANPYVG